MRLIDADLLKANCKITGDLENHFQFVDLVTLGTVIDNQPTAYDVEKVVKRLDTYITKMVGRNSALYQTVMQIVKGGGVDGD